jgi:dissimilatory sulfite reductase (desulfoviridin) alpha/beta subunit
VASASETVEEQQVKIQPPTFFMRLGLEAEAQGHSKVAKVAPLAWSLSSGQNWPVFVKRLRFPQPAPTSTLKNIALAARRFADNRLCLGPTGDLDVFFNDRGSLEGFNRQIAQSDPLASPAPVRIMACRGLLNCPLAAVDSITTAERLGETFSAHQWATIGAKRRLPLTLSVAGCQAGCGLDCGLYEYTDLRFVGKRRFIPLIDQHLASLSSKISLLVTQCPGQAINRSHLPGLTIEIQPNRCRRCGWCLSQDPSFAWPEPQGGYISLELSGRRLSPPYDFAAPRTVWPTLPEDWVEVSLKLIEFIELWRSEARQGEILADFALRRGLTDFGGEGSGADLERGWGGEAGEGDLN